MYKVETTATAIGGRFEGRRWGGMMRAVSKVLGLALFGAMVGAAPARAAYEITFTDTIGGILATGGGTLNLDGLDDYFGTTIRPYNLSEATVAVGRPVNTTLLEYFGGQEGEFLGPSTFTTEAVAALVPVSTSGTPIALYNWINRGNTFIGIQGGSDLQNLGVSTTQFAAGTKIAGLKLAANSFTYKWGSGANADSLTVRFIPGIAASVPEPSTWAMMIGGFGLIGGAMRRRNKTATTHSFA